MSMEITQILPTQTGDIRLHQSSTQARDSEAAAQVVQVAQKQNQDFHQAVEELRRVSQVFNKRLSFNYIEDLDMVVVKVIDRETDKVIKELPPDALQRVHMRIREAIGLLFDETV